ncbi:MAG: helicase-associated domain-containing protein [Treponemataceae bacterium]|nr:helicase-associated domain-containing protein [Treponemataceae bacterium]
MAEIAFWNCSFPSIEKWKEALLALPDGTFLQLIRAYLGPVKTPYNKSRLIEDLQRFLSQDEVQQAVEIYLDPFDWQCVAAIMFLGEPEWEEVLYFFDPDYALGTLHERLVNLEERLIIFRYSDEEKIRLAINPLFRPVLGKHLSPALLFSSFGLEEGVLGDSDSAAQAMGFSSSTFSEEEVLAGELAGGASKESEEISVPREGFSVGNGGSLLSAEKAGLPLVGGTPEAVDPMEDAVSSGSLVSAKEKTCEKGPFWVPWTELSLGALVVFLWHGQDLFRKDGSFTKKGLSQLGRLFPERDVAREILPLIGACEALGLFSLEEGILSWNEPCLEEFACLENTSRISYLIVGLWVRKEEKLPFFERRRRFHYLLQVLLLFLKALPAHQRCSSGELRKLLIVAERAVYKAERRWGRSSQSQDLHPFSRRSEELWDYLVWFGLLVPRGPGQWQRVEILPLPQTERKIHIESAQSIIVFPGTSFAELLMVGRFCRLVGIDQTLHFELNRDDVIKAFDAEWKANDIKEFLQHLSEYPLPENLLYLLDEWERRYYSVMIYQGPVLVLGKDRQYLAETEALKSYIRETLAPGVYLLSVRDPAPVQEALKRAGVDIIAQPPHPETGPAFGFLLSSLKSGSLNQGRVSPFSSKGGHFFPLPVTFPEVSLEKVAKKTLVWKNKNNEALLHRMGLQKKLAELSLSPEQKEELQSRIERRIILSESQLIPQSVRYERLEARGLDYVGKVRLVEQALAHHSLLEVLCRGPHGEPLKYVGEPKALEKRAAELYLVLKNHPEGQEKAIPLGKISYIRRIRTSLFEES